MLVSIATGALRQSKRLRLDYDGYARVVEVHVIGKDKDGHDIMLVWQVAGGSKSNERLGWKALKLHEATGAMLLDEDSDAPREGYNPHNNNAIKVVTLAI